MKKQNGIRMGIFIPALIAAFLLGLMISRANVAVQVQDVVDEVHYAAGINDGLKRGFDSCMTGTVRCPELNISGREVHGEFDNVTRTCSWERTRTEVSIKRP